MTRLALTARADCRICHGSGTFYEWHGIGLREPMDCECAFAAVPETDHAAWDQIDRGDYEIAPAPQRTPTGDT